MLEPRKQDQESGLPRGEIIQGDAATVMKGLPDHTVDQIFFFPPYFRLRDYGVGKNKGELNCFRFYGVGPIMLRARGSVPVSDILARTPLVSSS